MDAVKQAGSKLLGLEIIRFVAAFAVLVWHYQHFFYVADAPVDFVREQQPFYGLFKLFYDYGFYGVQVFWCISGFIFFWKYRDILADRLMSPGKFFVLRFSRLYPLHIVTLLLVAGLQMAYFSGHGYYMVYPFNDLKHFALQLFMASNWGLQDGESFNGPIWSVSIEVLVYLGFYLGLTLLGKSALINIAVVVGCAAAKAAGVHTPILDCFAVFYMGGLSAIALRHFGRTRLHRPITLAAWAVLVLVPVAAVATGIASRGFFAPLFLMCYVPVLLYVAATDVQVPPALQRAIEVLGNLTYASYLIHFPVQLCVAMAFGALGMAIPGDSPLLFIGFIGGTLLASYFVFKDFEMPAQRWLRNAYKGQRPLQAAVRTGRAG
jgi:peptidoglycan/LPS O-acetylase OafA/YrhL